MSEIKIVIPSHKRAMDVKSKKVLPTAIICVPENQVDEYKYYNSEMEILGHPNEVIGLSRKRQWIYEQFGDVIMADDDILNFVKVFLDKKDQKELGIKLTVSEIWGLTQDIYNICKETDIKFFGLNNSANPQVYSGAEPINLGAFITGGFFGIIKHDNFFFPPIDHFVREDVFTNCLNAFLNRKCWIDRRFAVCFYKMEANQGGCADYRTDDLRKQSYHILKEYFGNAVRPKKISNKKINRIKNNDEVSLNIPFW
ncbi:MAG: hypothetical protein A2163_00760 [Actinobacteria bacterium RBG_13_35_12]|nr:MAG: hypothetical protein A2163_00760 [Actinobacteria bacterium RBG_13_35_12]